MENKRKSFFLCFTLLHTLMATVVVPKGKVSAFSTRTFLEGRDPSMSWGFRQAGLLQLILAELNIAKWFNDNESLPFSLVNYALVTGGMKWVCGLRKGLEHVRGGRNRRLLLWLEKL